MRKILIVLLPSIFLAGSFAEMYSGITRKLITHARFKYGDKTKGVIKGDKQSYVECPKKALTIGFAGQSNHANRIPRKELVKKIENAYMFDYVAGKCQPYSEPIVGTDGEGNGHLASETIYALRSSGELRPIIVVAFSRGGSPIVHWSHGPLNRRTSMVSDSLRNSELELDYLLWHQGESDMFPHIGHMNKYYYFGKSSIGTPRTEWYQDLLASYIRFARTKFPFAKVGIAQASYCIGDDSAGVRKAQLNVTKLFDHVQLTLNTDELQGTKYRYDDCHFNATAGKIIGKSYAVFISNNQRSDSITNPH